MSNKLISCVVVSRNRKEDLIDCIKSLKKSNYRNLEIIVLDNGSDRPISVWFKKRFSAVTLITSQNNLGAAGGRNLALKSTQGDFILFMDDDAIADQKMISSLVKVLEDKKSAGIVQPIIYDKDRTGFLEGAGHDISLTTGRIKAWGAKEIDLGQYNFLREIPLARCIWMVKRKIIEKIGGYDERYFIPYEDSDFSFRARKAGFKIFCVPDAKAWHTGRKTKFANFLVEWIGITSVERAFRISRNKLIYMSKHAPNENFLVFLFFFQPIYLMVHSIIIILSLRFDVLVKYWQGVLEGLYLALLIRTNLYGSK